VAAVVVLAAILAVITIMVLREVEAGLNLRLELVALLVHLAIPGMLVLVPQVVPVPLSLLVMLVVVVVVVTMAAAEEEVVFM
jgi:hypothetical protein